MCRFVSSGILLQAWVNITCKCSVLCGFLQPGWRSAVCGVRSRTLWRNRCHEFVELFRALCRGILRSDWECDERHLLRAVQRGVLLPLWIDD